MIELINIYRDCGAYTFWSANVHQSWPKTPTFVFQISIDIWWYIFRLKHIVFFFFFFFFFFFLFFFFFFFLRLYNAKILPICFTTLSNQSNNRVFFSVGVMLLQYSNTDFDIFQIYYLDWQNLTVIRIGITTMGTKGQIAITITTETAPQGKLNALVINICRNLQHWFFCLSEGHLKKSGISTELIYSFKSW